MADETPSLHIDSDWKKQAQEEKRKLAEEQQKAAAAKPAAATAPSAPGAPKTGPAQGRAGGSAKARQLPAASFGTLVQSMATSALYSLADAEGQGADPAMSLDLAKHHIDSLGILEEKTKGNLTDDEKKLLETALYQVRMQFVQVGSRFTL